jgi:hypothetical protein
VTTDELIKELRTMARELSKIVGGRVEQNTAWRGATAIAQLRKQLRGCQFSVVRLKKELSECRGLLADVVATVPPAAPNRPNIKAAADWLANWDGERV